MLVHKGAALLDGREVDEMMGVGVGVGVGTSGELDDRAEKLVDTTSDVVDMGLAELDAATDEILSDTARVLDGMSGTGDDDGSGDDEAAAEELGVGVADEACVVVETICGVEIEDRTIGDADVELSEGVDDTTMRLLEEEAVLLIDEDAFDKELTPVLDALDLAELDERLAEVDDFAEEEAAPHWPKPCWQPPLQ